MDDDLRRAIALSLQSSPSSSSSFFSSPPWLCVFCTKENGASVAACTACGIYRDRERRVSPQKNAAPSASSSAPPPSSSSSSSSNNGPFTCATCTFLNVSGPKCSVCETPRPVVVGPPWTCCACTSKNADDDKKCIICGTEKPRYEMFLVEPRVIAQSEDTQYMAILNTITTGGEQTQQQPGGQGTACSIPSVPTSQATFSLRRTDLGEIGSRFWSYVLQEVGDSYTILQLEQAGAINWSDRTTLFPLRTRGDGKCLCHAASLAMWGIEDDSEFLKRALICALDDATLASELRLRWETELLAADGALPEEFRVQRNFEADWAEVLDRPRRSQDDLRDDGRRVGIGGASLMNIHVFVLAQVLRRPIVVVADSKSAVDTGEGMAGIYLPSLCPKDECSRAPLWIAYTPGHFIALVPIQGQSTHAPLCNKDGVPLEIKFEDHSIARPLLLREWIDCVHDFPPTVRESVPLTLEVFASILPSSVQLYTHYIAQARGRFKE